MKSTNFKTIFNIVLFLIQFMLTGSVTAAEKNSVENQVSNDAKEIFVSPEGNDLDPGTREKPFITVQKALENIIAGDTVTLLKGRYMLENSVILSCKGRKDAWIILRGEKGSRAILDGQDYNIDNTEDYPHNKGLVQIQNAEYLRIQNICVKNSHRAGINIQDSKNIDIINCKTENSLSPGISAWQHCEHIRILGNTVINANDSTMSSTTYKGSEAPHEAISMAGPHYFEVAFNHVYNCKKEGIDVKETAAHGKVYHNYVHDCLRQGLYIDGWFGQLEDISLCMNVVHDCEAGIAVSSEEGPNTKDLKIHHNLIYNNRATGIFFSRWGADNPRENVEVYNNTFYRNGWGPNFSGDPQYWLNGGCYLYSTNVKNVIIHHNIFAFNFPFEIGRTSLLYEDRMKAQDIIIDFNLIYDKNEFEYPIYLERWAKDSVYSITGTNAILKEPVFENPDKGDFRLKDDFLISIEYGKEMDNFSNYPGVFPAGTVTDDFWWKQNFPPEINVDELK